jgi:hypothetical protein
MEYKTGEFNRLMRAIDDTEKLYSPEGYNSRGPEVILQEYNQMQLEGYKVQQNFHKMIVDAKTIGVSIFDIRRKLKDQGVGSKMINNLMNGVFTPINYSDARFKKKVKSVESFAKDKSKNSADYRYVVDPNYLYPKLQLNLLKNSYRFKKLDPDNKLKIYAEGKNPNTGGIFGSFLLDKLVPGTPFKDGPGLIQRGKNLINKVLPGDPMSKIQTPPLSDTPMPAKMASNTLQKNPVTNLTQTEEALLSPTEKIIASRT